ncbi:MAG: AmmeMemoRadiSam system radical SAM enzyme [Desulfatiglans sp.]|jgi:pyruvate formate lyase activating enzyme|nr:AmmeMemoRadiSam system radical SAM enzyme [Desulfatiglans sp.]
MKKLYTRKEFIRRACLCTGATLFFFDSTFSNGAEQGAKKAKSIRGTLFRGDAPDKPWKWSIEAKYYEKKGRDTICLLCPNRCYLKPGDRSVCRSRVNIGGKLYSLAYGNPCSIHVDPIEKKPLNHFHPGSSVFSIAATGCNLRCLNCQNWEISQKRPEDVTHGELFPKEVVASAKKKQAPSIAFTYSEAITYYEYMFDTARLARDAGIKSILVSNGYINDKPLIELAPFIDGANINLKSFDNNIYMVLNGGTLAPVLNTLKRLKENNVWFEITTLVVPTYIDDPDMIKRMCGWILKELGADYPLHFSRFFPNYRLNRLPPTPVSQLEEFRNLARKEGLHYVYLGNVPAHEGNNTYCHNCGKLLIERTGYTIGKIDITKGKCIHCGTLIPGRWSA